MSAYLCHAPCKKPIATFIGKHLPEPGYTIKSRDFRLLNGRRPNPFSSIVCPHCKCVAMLNDLYLELDDVIQHLNSHSH
jgi:hypothetical protein